MQDTKVSNLVDKVTGSSTPAAALAKVRIDAKEDAGLKREAAKQSVISLIQRVNNEIVDYNNAREEGKLNFVEANPLLVEAITDLLTA